MMTGRQAIGTMRTAQGIPAARTGKDQLVGVYKLISCERKAPDGRIDYPYGEKPIGRLTYDKAGRMSAQLMRPGRRSTIAPGALLTTANAGTEELGEAVEGFIAYFGTFDLAESGDAVIHHVQACLVPSWVGTDQKRTFRFDANHLVLTATSDGAVVELVWEQEPDWFTGGTLFWFA